MCNQLAQPGDSIYSLAPISISGTHQMSTHRISMTTLSSAYTRNAHAHVVPRAGNA